MSLPSGMRPAHSQSRRRGWTSAAVLAGYVVIAFGYWGARLLPHPARYYVGTGTDPQIFIWSLRWWPHAWRVAPRGSLL